MAGRDDPSRLNVGLCVVEIHLPGSGSLKQKRQVVRSLKDRLRGHYNVALAEIDNQDLWQRATIGIVSIGSARTPLERTFESIRGELDRRPPGEILSFEVEYLT